MLHADGVYFQSFEEMVQYYRQQAYRWACSVTDDPYLAEDAVQDAFLNIYMRRESLMEIRNFTSWLYRVVRNEALMKIRKRRGRRRESLLDLRTMPDDHIPVSYQEANTDPNLEYLKLESEQVLQSLLANLNDREREIFRDYTFNSLETHEITAKYNISVSNYYQLLSRARKKLQQARYRYFLNQYLDSLKRSGTFQRKQIDMPYIYMGEVWDSASACLMTIMKNIYQQDWSLTRVMGMSAQAFRMTIHQNELSVVSPLAFHWGRIFSEAFLNLGFKSTYMWNADQRRSPELYLDALDMIRQSILSGIPVICWNVRNPLFGLIHGFDDERKQFNLLGFGDHKTAHYEDLLQGELFIMKVKPCSAVDEETRFLKAIRMILDHSHEQDDMNGSVSGLSAYGEWIRILENNPSKQQGIAFSFAYYSDVRKHAYLFLQECLDSTEEHVFYQRPSLRIPLEQAIIHYKEVYQVFRELRRTFPFPDGLREGEQLSDIVALLKEAWRHETLGIRELDKIM